VDDTVWYNGSLYQCIQAGKGEDPKTQTAFWKLANANAGKPAGAWLSTTTYVNGDFVTGSDGCIYQSIVVSNKGNDPLDPKKPNFWQRVSEADTDGDGILDAVFVKTGVADPSGNPIYVALKTTDSSGLINVNTAGKGAPWTCPTHPAVRLAQAGKCPLCGANLFMDADYIPTAPIPVPPPLTDWVNLSSLLPPATYTALHAQRAQTDNPAKTEPLVSYTREAGLIPTAPLTGLDTTPTINATRRYLPFAVGDEAYLRSSAACGRLYTLLGGIPASQRNMLTTWNGSTVGLRHPSGADLTRLPMWKLNAVHTPSPAGPITGYSIDSDTTFTGNSAADVTNRTALYTKLASITGNDRLAAHFVANLWAYSYAGVDATNQSDCYLHAFRCDFPTSTNPTITVYGAIEQLVISEVMVWNRYAYDPNATPPVDDPQAGYCAAVKLYNPNSVAVYIHGYELHVGTNVAKIQDQLIAPYSSLVVYDLKGTLQDGTTLVSTIFPMPTGAIQDPALKTAGTDTITLVRAVNDEQNNPVIIPLDEVTVLDTANDPNILPAGKGYTPPAKPAGTAGATSNQSGMDYVRDDDKTVLRALVAQYLASANPVTEAQPGNKLSAANNGVALADLPVLPGFTMTLAHTPSVSSAELGKIMLVGPEDAATGTAHQLTIPQQLVTNGYMADPGRARVDFSGRVNTTNAAYPDVPWADLLSELIDFVPADPTRPIDSARPTVLPHVYGRVNINTASKDVLKQLPWPATIPGTATALDTDEVARFIMAYRDGGSITVNSVLRNFGIRFTSPTTSAIPYIAQLRAAPPAKGFVTPGELALVLNDYMNIVSGLTTPGAPFLNAQAANYLDNRNALYAPVANLITVNSDVFSANVVVELRDKNNPTSTKSHWRYVMVFDRGNCTTTAHRPAILMMTEVN